MISIIFPVQFSSTYLQLIKKEKRKKMVAIFQAWAPDFFFYPVPRDGSTASSGFNLPTVRGVGWGRLRDRW